MLQVVSGLPTTNYFVIETRSLPDKTRFSFLVFFWKHHFRTEQSEVSAFGHLLFIGIKSVFHNHSTYSIHIPAKHEVCTQVLAQSFLSTQASL